MWTEIANISSNVSLHNYLNQSTWTWDTETGMWRADARMYFISLTTRNIGLCINIYNIVFKTKQDLLSNSQKNIHLYNLLKNLQKTVIWWNLRQHTKYTYYSWINIHICLLTWSNLNCVWQVSKVINNQVRPFA